MKGQEPGEGQGVFCVCPQSLDGDSVRHGLWCAVLGGETNVYFAGREVARAPGLVVWPIAGCSMTRPEGTESLSLHFLYGVRIQPQAWPCLEE